MATRQAYQITSWFDSSKAAGRSGLGRRAEWPLCSGTQSWSGQLLSALHIFAHCCDPLSSYPYSSRFEAAIGGRVGDVKKEEEEKKSRRRRRKRKEEEEEQEEKGMN